MVSFYCNTQRMQTKAHAHPRYYHKKVIPLCIAFLIGLAIAFIPHSAEVSDQAWRLFAVFIATIVAIILKPFPIGAISILSLAAVASLHILTLEEVLGGFNNSIVWLVVFAFFIARGFVKSGLGTRIAYGFISLFGKKTLGLSYGLLFSELLLAPAIPSLTARSGGVIFPILQGLSLSYGSDPKEGTQKKIGSFLIKTAYQGSVITSAMFVTAMASNPLIVSLSAEAGFHISWGKWALGALVPGLLSLILVPFIIYKIYPPEIKDTPDAPQMAKSKLLAMGKVKTEEWMMLVIFVVLLLLWLLGESFGINATVAALLGLALLVLTGVLQWHDITREENAWDTFIWFSTLIMLATFLSKKGFTPWFSEQIVEVVQGFHWAAAFGILFFIYFYSHYFFASSTAHVGAMFPAFLMVAIGLGTPPLLAIAALGYASSLFGGLTHYGLGSAPLFFGSGYVDIKSWWWIGLLISFVNIIIWIGLGSLWWKFLGFW